MKKIVFITGINARYGFGLAGITHYVAGQGELDETIRKIISRSDIGLLVVDEELARELSDERVREIESLIHGIFLILPSPEKAAEVEDYAAQLIRKAVGYHVRIRT